MVNAVNCIRIIGIRISFDLDIARGYTLKARRYNAYACGTCPICLHRSYSVDITPKGVKYTCVAMATHVTGRDVRVI